MQLSRQAHHKTSPRSDSQALGPHHSQALQPQTRAGSPLVKWRFEGRALTENHKETHHTGPLLPFLVRFETL
jgi:hypothetical protein